MNKILSAVTILSLLFASYQSSVAEPANLSMLKDIKIAMSVDNTQIELVFDKKPVDEKISFRDEFVQIEISDTYTDPAKQWLKVEDEIVKNIFVYQYDENTVRLRLFTYGNAVNMREKISISKVNNGLMISYDQKLSGVNKMAPVAAKVNVKRELKKSAVLPIAVKLPKIAEPVSTPVQNNSQESVEEISPNMSENQNEVLTEQAPAETGTELLKTETLPPGQNTEEVKTELMKDSPGFTTSFIKMVTALGIVLSLLFAIVYIVKKYLGKKIGLTGQEQKIRVVTSTYLGPKKSIALVEVAGEKIVVGVTATHISMLTKVGRDEDFGEVLKEKINTESTIERVELQDELWEKV